ERVPEFLQHRALFNMKLNVTQAVLSQGGLRNFRWPQPKLFNRFLEGDAILVPAVQKLRIQAADKSAAADEQPTKSNPFPFRKSDDFNPKRKPPPFQNLN